MLGRVLAIVGLAGAVAAAMAGVATVGEPPGSPATNEALDICEHTPERPTAPYQEQFERGIRLAEGAIAANEGDAKAHFALFCNLAKLTHIRGYSVSSLVAVFRLHREIDRTLELQPGYVDALTAKGAFVLNLPRLLGGDPREAERLLRLALELDPTNTTARRFHSEALEAMGIRPQP